MSPTCCEASEENGTVFFFEPANQSSPAHWTVPLRTDGKVNPHGCTAARFCPFCGTRLGREHIPFDGDSAPYGSATPRTNAAKGAK